MTAAGISFSFRPEDCVASDRSDAFHFQPRFREIAARLHACTPEYRQRLTSVAAISDQTIDPRRKPTEVFTYVEIEDVSPVTGEVRAWSSVRGALAPSRARKVIPQDSILVSTVRPVRRAVALAPAEVVGGVCSTGFSVLVPRQDIVQPEFLWAFLRCKYGAAQLEQLGRGASYPAVLESELGEITVIVPRKQLRNAVVAKVQKARESRRKARAERDKALAVFDDKLPLDFGNIRVISSSMTAKECAVEARVDAGFFAPHYVELAATLRTTFSGVKRLDALVKEPIHRGKQPVYQDGVGTVPVVKTVDVQNERIEWLRTRKVSEEFFQENPQGQLHKGDLVITSTGIGSWGKAALCDVEKAFAAVDLVVVHVDQVVLDPLVLLALVWSKSGKVQFHQRARGSTRMTHLYERDIATLLVPSLSPSQRDKVIAAMALYFKALQEADHYGDQAIAAVEAFIEGGGR